MTDTCSFKRDLLMIKLSYILPQFLWPTLIKLPLSSAWSKLLEVSNVVPKYFDQGILVICLLLNLKAFQMLQETRETIFDIWHWQQRNEVKMWSSQLLSQFKQLQIKLKKDFRASMGFKPITSGFVLQFFTTWAMKNHTLGAD